MPTTYRATVKVTAPVEMVLERTGATAAEALEAATTRAYEIGAHRFVTILAVEEVA